NSEFGAFPTSSASARHLVSDLLERWELPSLRDDAELLTGELVNNAVGHASTDLALVVAVAVAEGILEIGVTDSDPHSIRFVKPKGAGMDATARDLAEGGRGLPLVGLLADEWGVVGLRQGKQVWFRLSTNDWSYNSACPCHGLDRGRGRGRPETGRDALA